jgi:ABC-2 type transport system ATP-binding protein
MDASSPAFCTDMLSKVFPGGAVALQELTVTVPRGSVGLVGANGAGKTTLFRLLLGLIRPTGGRVEVCGHPVADDPIGVRSRLGFMPEHDCLAPDQTAADLVSSFGELSGLPMRAARQRASDVLDLVGLDEARFRPVGGFSTGMRQRTKLAQALVADPELVLLDEPTAGLDPIGREEMLALVGRLSTFGISVVLATHLLDDVQAVCDHVVMIDAGRLVLAGPTTQLLERAGTVRVDVGRTSDGVVDELARRGMAATILDDGSLEISGNGRSGDEVLDTVRDVVAQLGLPLHALSTRHASLDEVFLRTAGER